MSVLFAIALIIMLGYVFYSKFKVNMAFTPFLAISVIGVVLFFFGIINLLSIGIVLLYIFGTICFVIEIMTRKSRRELYCYLAGAPTIAFLGGCLFFLIIYSVYPQFYKLWDEFTHWGPFFKSIFDTKRLHIFYSNDLVHTSYPQGIVLMYGLFSFFEKQFSESTTFLTMAIVLCACATTLMFTIKCQRIGVMNICEIIFVAIFFTLFPAVWPYTSVYFDAINGAYCGACVCFINGQTGDCRHRILLVLMTLMALVQIKSISIVLVLVCIADFFIKELSDKYCTEKITFGCLLKKYLRPTLSRSIFLIIGVALSSACWYAVLMISGNLNDQFTQSGMTTFFSMFGQAMRGENDYFTTAWEIFKDAFFSKGIILNEQLGSFSIIVILIVTPILCVSKCGSARLKHVSYIRFIEWGVFFLCYQFVIFYSSVTAMPEEAMSCSSYPRYIATFSIIWVMFIMSYALNIMDSYTLLREKKVSSLVIILCSTFIFMQIYNGQFWDDVKLRKLETWRPQMDEISSEVLSIIEKGDRIWVISENEFAEVFLAPYRYKYTLLPAQVNDTLPWASLGGPYWLGNIGLTEQPVDIYGIVKDYNINYILINSCDAEWVKEYENYFEGDVSKVIDGTVVQLYKVIVESDQIKIQICKQINII